MASRASAPLDELRRQIARRAPVAAPELGTALGLPVTTLHRLLGQLQPELIVAGRARRTRYALRRSLPGTAASELPLFEVDAQGRAHERGSVALRQPQGAWADLAAIGWPVPEEARDGWWDGLPYALFDMRPQGYLGRQLARAEHRALGVGPNPEAWSDDELLQALSRIGTDCSGALILGEPAFERWQQARLDEAPPLPEQGLAAAYAALAEQAVAQGVPGSSAAGEFPKFGARRAGPVDATGAPTAATPHVLVKFSGADASPAVRRWSDLLVCEHLALQQAARLPGVSAARSRILRDERVAGGRTFLEVERFDRHGAHGRSPLVSLGTLDAALLGSGSADWPLLAARLQAGGWLEAAAVSAVEHLWWFGRLIANSDMHAGNLSFVPAEGRLRLAPAYDLLPMAFAPLPGGELPQPELRLPLPLPSQRAVWRVAADAAARFWQAAAADSRIGDGFRAIARAMGERLAAAVAAA